MAAFLSKPTSEQVRACGTRGLDVLRQAIESQRMAYHPEVVRAVEAQGTKAQAGGSLRGRREDKLPGPPGPSEAPENSGGHSTVWRWERAVALVRDELCLWANAEAVVCGARARLVA